jgi:hypothetical protein
MKIYDLVKDKLPEAKGVISDNEICAINRRDFLYSETSSTSSFLRVFGAEKVTYEMYAIVDFISASLCKVKKENNIRVFQLSQSMTLASLAVSSMIGDKVSSIRIHAPRGVQKVIPGDPFASIIYQRFEEQLNTNLQMNEIGKDENSIDIIFCNASNEAEVSSGLKSFENVKKGFVLIKGYGREGAPNCGEIILNARLHVHSTIAGFGFSYAI